jgi:hypothetical protein
MISGDTRSGNACMIAAILAFSLSRMNAPTHFSKTRSHEGYLRRRMSIGTRMATAELRAIITVCGLPWDVYRYIVKKPVKDC